MRIKHSILVTIVLSCFTTDFDMLLHEKHLWLKLIEILIQYKIVGIIFSLAVPRIFITIWNTSHTGSHECRSLIKDLNSTLNFAWIMTNLTKILFEPFISFTIMPLYYFQATGNSQMLSPTRILGIYWYTTSKAYNGYLCIIIINIFGALGGSNLSDEFALVVSLKPYLEDQSEH